MAGVATEKSVMVAGMIVAGPYPDQLMTDFVSILTDG